eukprot:213060_1
MGWLGFGGGDNTNEAPSPGYNDTPHDGFSDGFGHQDGAVSGGMDIGGGTGGGIGTNDLQEILMQEQQKALIMQAVLKLTEVAFDSCIDRPNSSLSMKDQKCVQSAVMKFFDTNEFCIARLRAKK